VLGRRVASSEGRSNAALCVAGVALGGIGLGKDQHVARVRQICGSAEACDAAANDQEIRATRHRMLS
jgi:hypothetical protein